jgi:hypothetical protein
MSGFQEILLIAVILLGIFFIPRMTARQSGRPAIRSARPQLPGLPTGKLRLALVASLLWLLGTLVYFEPWRNSGLKPFLIWGLGPVVVFWCARWVWKGFNKKR